MAQLAKAPDTQSVGHGFEPIGSNIVRTIKIGITIIFRSDLI